MVSGFLAKKGRRCQEETAGGSGRLARCALDSARTGRVKAKVWLEMQEFAVTGAQSPAGLFALEILKMQLSPLLYLILFAAFLLK